MGRRPTNYQQVNERGAYVQIQSSKNIKVTMGLQYQDVTNPDAHVPDRLKVSPSWPKANVLIKIGQHLYPSEIVEWPTVQALVKDGILTIGAFMNDANENVKTEKTNLIDAINVVEKESQKSLSDIAGE